MSAPLHSNPAQFSDNSLGATSTISNPGSVALSDLSLASLFESDSALRNLRQFRLNLRKKAEKYSNTRIQGDGRAYQQWECTEDEAQLVHMAVVCSKAVYDIKQRNPTLSRHHVKRIYALPPTADGTVKAASLYVVERMSINRGCIITAVVAVRGTRTLADWAVNFNRGSTNASPFIAVDQIRDLTGNSNARQTNVHRGFLHAAQELVPYIWDKLKSILVDNPGSLDVVFTGHSAGGAVVSLLFAHFLSHAFSKYQEQLLSQYVRLSCITFGAPPIFTTNEFPTFRSLQNPDTLGLIGKGLILSFINEGDPLPRADEPFVNVLLDLLAEPSSIDPTSPQDSKSRGLFRSRSQRYASGSTKQLPAISLFGLGELILIRDANADGDGDGEQDLRLCSLRPQELEKFLFANFFAHHKDVYVEHIAAIAKGEFNGGRTWAHHTILGTG